MFRRLLPLMLLCMSLSAIAQNAALEIRSIQPRDYCLGGELAIGISTTAKFAPDNKFTVTAYRGYNDPSQRWEYPAVLKGDQLITVLKDPALANGNDFNIKIASSNPKLESSYNYSARAQTNATIRLSTVKGTTADTLNASDDIMLMLTVKPNNRAEITLSTGDIIELNPNYYTGDSAAIIHTISANKAAEIFIQKATNACGNLKTEGLVKLKLNAFDFKPISVSSPQTCIGSTVKVKFATDGGSFGKDTKYKVRLQRDNDGSGTFKFYDLPATLTGKNELSVTIPENIPDWLISSGGNVGIVTENPGAKAINAKLWLYIYPKPSFKLTSYNTTIDLGSSTYIFGEVSGLQPYKFTLNTGEVFENSIYVSPNKTTQYSVKTFESGCGIIENPAQTPLQIKVNPGLFLPDPESVKKRAFACEGETVRLPFKALGVNAQTTYRVEAGNYNNNTISIPAKVVGDSIEFTIPKNATANALLDYGDVWSIRVVSARPALTSPNTSFKLKSIPAVKVIAGASYEVPYPSVMQVSMALRGGGPYEAVAKDGTIKTFDHPYFSDNQYVRKDTTFKLASLSNACFKNSDPSAVALKVTDPKNTSPSLFAKIVPRKYCAADSLELQINFNGKFDAGNVFKLSYTASGQGLQFFMRNITKNGIYKFSRTMFPENAQNIIFILESSSPSLESRTELSEYIARPAIWELYPQSTKEYPSKLFISDNTTVTITTNAKNLIKYSVDGRLDSAYSDQNGSKVFDLKLVANKTTEFKIHSVSNQCGTFNGQLSTFLLGVPYQIDFQPPYASMPYCEGTDVTLPFEIRNGNVNAATKFTLQISEEGKDNFTDVSTISGATSFKFVVPKIKSGTYLLRVRSSDLVYSDTRFVSVGHVPEVSIGSYMPVDAEGNSVANYGQPFPIIANLSGNTPWGALLSNGDKNESSYSSITFMPVIKKRETFSVTKSWNSCGFGAVSNSLTVEARPTLSLNSFPETYLRYACAGQSVTLDYKIDGFEILAKNYLVFSVKEPNGNEIKIDSVWQSAGRIALKIPAQIKAQAFTIIGRIPSTTAENYIDYQQYVAPDLSLFGSKTITEGESAYIYTQANNTFSPGLSYELSTGEKFIRYSHFKGGVEQLFVTPKVTTTYKINELKNVCGNAKFSGLATITVEPRRAKWIRVNSVSGASNYRVCKKDTMLVHFEMNGAAMGSANMQVVLVDSSGKDTIHLQTLGRISPLRAIVPATIRTSSYYYVRLIARDNSISGGTLLEPVRIGEHASLKILNPIVFYKEGERPQPILILKGSQPFYYTVSSKQDSYSYMTNNLRDTVWISNVIPDSEYRIHFLMNECGSGQIEGPSTFRLQESGGSLPVSLIDFNVKKSENTAALTWRTTSEYRSESFEIQHATDGKNWKSLGAVAAKGDSDREVNYHYLHAGPVLGADNFYRLKMIDADKTFAYSKIEQLYFEGGPEISIYPNPAPETIHLEVSNWASVAEVQLLDLQGNAVYRSGKVPSKKISVKSFSPGIYILRIIHADKSELNRKIVVGR